MQNATDRYDNLGRAGVNRLPHMHRIASHLARSTNSHESWLTAYRQVCPRAYDQFFGYWYDTNTINITRVATNICHSRECAARG